MTTPTDHRTARIPDQRRAGLPDAPTVRLPVIGGTDGVGSRVRGVDAARGLALLGMIAVHTVPTSVDGRVTTVGLVAGGTSAALFAVLVGVSVALLTGRRSVALGTRSFGRHALRLVVRGLAVGTVGLALGEAALGSVDIILTYYGVLFLLAVPLVLLPARALVALGAVLAVVAPVTSVLVRAPLAPTELVDPSFSVLAADPGGLLTSLFFTGAYPAWPWLAYLCVGIAVGRCPLTRTRTAALLAAGGVLLAVAATVVSRVALGAGGLGHILADPGLPADELRAALGEGLDGVTPTTTWWWLAVDSAHSSTPLDLAGTIGTSLAVLGAMLLLDRALDRGRSTPVSRAVSVARAPLAAAGSMTLTLYTLHVVVSGVASDADPWPLYVVQITVALLGGLLWRRFVGRGPLESAVGTLTGAAAPTPVPADGDGRPARTAAAVLVAVLILTVVLGGAFAVAASRPTDATTPAAATATSEPADGPSSATDGPDQPDDQGADGPDDADDPEEQTRPDSAGDADG